MQKQNTKDNLDNNTTPITLEDGQKVVVDGQELIFEKGKFKLSESDKAGESEKHFYLYFRNNFANDVKQIDGCKVIKTGKYVILDIFPLIKKLFGTSINAAGGEFRGTEFACGNQVEQIRLPFDSMMQNLIQKKITRMLDMSVVNQNQRKGYESYIQDIFTDIWSDFYSKF